LYVTFGLNDFGANRGAKAGVMPCIVTVFVTLPAETAVQAGKSSAKSIVHKL